jgi:hypothetical protein
MASQTVTFEMAGRDEFDNAVDHLGAQNQALLEFQATFDCTLGTSEPCTSQGAGVTSSITYLPNLNRYLVSFTVDSGGNAATLQMTLTLGNVVIAASSTADAYEIAVRAAQNEPSLCYVLSPEAGTSDQRAAANSPTTDPERRGRDCLNLDHKIAGDSLNFVMQSVLQNGADRSFPDWRTVCTPANNAIGDTDCDRLDEFELVAINQVTQEQAGPFRDDCADLCGEGESECPNYSTSECISAGLYGISWSTITAGDWEVTVRSLGVMIQTEPGCPDGSLRDLYSDPPGRCTTSNETRAARFDRSNLLATGYLLQVDAVLASFVTHVYPAAMSATTSEFELTTECPASTPCMEIGNTYTVIVTAMDQYGNQLEEETDAQGQVCATPGCLGARVRATLQTECRDDSPGLSLCSVEASAFAYDTNDDYPGHLSATVLPVIAGLAKLRVDFEVSTGNWVEFSSGKLPATVKFGVADPIPNSAFKRAGDATQVEGSMYGFLDPPANIVPEFACEWVGPSVGGVHRTPATLLTETLPNAATIELTIEGGGAGVSWELECNAAGSWDLITSGGGSARQYDEFSPCREDVSALRGIAEVELADDLRQANVVDWSVATCSSALEALGRYGVSCEVSDHLRPNNEFHLLCSSCWPNLYTCLCVVKPCAVAQRRRSVSSRLQSLCIQQRDYTHGHDGSQRELSLEARVRSGGSGPGHLTT